MKTEWISQHGWLYICLYLYLYITLSHTHTHTNKSWLDAHVLHWNRLGVVRKNSRDWWSLVFWPKCTPKNMATVMHPPPPLTTTTLPSFATCCHNSTFVAALLQRCCSAVAAVANRCSCC
jgi:hypothetical protein